MLISSHQGNQKIVVKFSTMQDKELVALLKEGSQQAFAELYIRYYDSLFFYCKKYLKDEYGAEDIVQDIFIQLWDTHDTINITSSFSGYIYTSAHNRILKMIRHFDVHLRYAQHILMNAKEWTNETEDSIMNNDFTALLNEMMERLSPKQKEVFRLSRIEGLTYKEISEMLQISIPAVQKHASIALEKIKEHLKQHTDIHFKTMITFLIFFS